MRNKIPELLAPAGSIESLRAAVNAGADAIYVGGAKYGARAYAENPEEADLIGGLRYAHRFGVRIHMTVNTLLKEAELQTLPDYIAPYYEAGLDAAIVQDLGALALLHEHFPLLSLHASTQTTITGPHAAELYRRLGVSRVIPARELSLEELVCIKRETGLEVESFVHGALCYAYSGQCFMSSLLGERSGNRGRCAQTCRLPYSLQRENQKSSGQGLLLSCKDLCSLDLIPMLAESGIDSLKIEGRMKSPRYTAGVVSIWRKYLDLYAREGAEGFQVEAADRAHLLDLFDRGGQTEGYYRQHNGREMIVLQEKKEKRKQNIPYEEEIEEKYLKTERELPLYGKFVQRDGEPMYLELSASIPGAGQLSAEVAGEIAERARTAGSTAEAVRERLQKTGGTGFRFAKLDVSIEEGFFFPVKQLNELRRKGIEAISAKIDAAFLRDSVRDTETVRAAKTDSENRTARTADTERTAPELHVSCDSWEQIQTVSAMEEVAAISFGADSIPAERWQAAVRCIQNAGKRAYLLLPQIFRTEAERFFREQAERLVDLPLDALIIRNLEEPSFFETLYGERNRRCPAFYFDFQVYGMNRTAQLCLREFGAARLTLPIEETARELKSLDTAGQEMVVAGRLPMMVSANCLKKTAARCDHKPEYMKLRDRRMMEMPVKTHCTFCYNTIYNAAPLSLSGVAAELTGLKLGAVRLLLSNESAAETKTAVRSIYRSFVLGELGVPEAYENFTRGHFKRAVE
ncbi:peptidase U32 family protein [Stomatobaculum longum]|uniref:peptidase U32 family protein n=1 Tax=Stomatobaculum longum TaxID=796942 RepID=UPI0028ECFAF5|nr:DUF3656 domain-containing protein [Stomatobaculum longum]